MYESLFLNSFPISAPRVYWGSELNWSYTGRSILGRRVQLVLHRKEYTGEASSTGPTPEGVYWGGKFNWSYTGRNILGRRVQLVLHRKEYTGEASSTGPTPEGIYWGGEFNWTYTEGVYWGSEFNWSYTGRSILGKRIQLVLHRKEYTGEASSTGPTPEGVYWGSEFNWSYTGRNACTLVVLAIVAKPCSAKRTLPETFLQS